MTKKKKTLRAAVLASIFAMAFSATAWGGPSDNYTEEGEYAFNPKLTGNSGSVSAGNEGTGNYEPKYNYYLQWYEYKKYLGTEDNRDFNQKLVERIVGVKMNESDSQVASLANYGLDTTNISVKGVQLFHVEYDKDGAIVSPDKVTDALTEKGISLAKEVDGTSVAHYCGESAKSISIGQIQRALEVMNDNDTSLSAAIVAEASKRFNTDLDHDKRIDTIALTDIDGDGKYTFTNDNGDKTTIDTNFSITSATQNSVEGKGEVTTYTITNNNNDKQFGEIVDTNKFVTGIVHSDINSEGAKKGKLTTTLTFNDSTTKETTVDIGKYVAENAGDAYYYEIDENGNKINVYNPITINQAITNNTNDITEVNNTIGNKADLEVGGDTIVQAINNTYEVAKKHNTVVAGDNNIVVQDKDKNGNLLTNAAGGIEYRVSLGTELSGLDKVNTTEVITEKVTLGVDNNNTSITYEQYNNEYRIKYGDNYVANLNDGMKYGADSGDELKLKLNEKLNVNGDNNITTVATAATENTPAQIQVKLNNDITVNSVTANSVYSNYVEAKVVNAEKVLSDYVEANRINAGVVDTDKVFSQYVETEIVNADKIFSEYGEIKLVNSETVSTGILTLRGNSKNTDVTFNDVANGNDGAQGRIEYKDTTGANQQVANLNDGKTFTGDSGSAFVKLQDGVNIKGGANVRNLSDGNIGVIAEANNDGSATLNVKLSKDITGLNSVTSTTVNSKTINVSEVVNINNKTQITENGININNKVIVEENNVNVGGNKIENVAPGELSPDSQDAVNGSQLFNTNQKLDRLGNRVDKVGAGAAALAALHPLDFDPDDKLSFSAGVGNYGSETATALGAFYRPSEKVMLSAAGTMGNGENMVNLGVTFALDKTNNVSNSRVAMAREIQDLKSHIVKQDAQIAELIALVGQLTGKSIGQSEDGIMFPDVPENHWAYEYIEGLQKRGIIEGYPDGNFGGDRSMTRYEYAAMLYRALEKGFAVDSRLLDEFDAELGRIRIDRIKGLDDDANKIERVRVNQYEDRDDYGSKLIVATEAE